jgi:glycosyltransferase involved in cell wall biosynthesis
MTPPLALFSMTFGERLGGAEAMLFTLLKHLDRDRLRPHVLFLAPGPFADDVAALGIDVSVVPTGRFREAREQARAVARIARLVRTLDPAVIVPWWTRDQVYAGAAAWLSGFSDRVVWWQHMVPPHDPIDRVATLIPARAIGTTSQAAARAQRRMRPRRPTFSVPAGVEEPATAAAPRPPGAPLVAVNVARLQPWKHQTRLLDALVHAPDVHAVFVGGDAHGLAPGYADALRDRADDLGVADRVTWTGQVGDAAPYIAAADVLVNLADSEPFGIALVEAMALRKPVVAVDAPGPREIVVDGVTGLIVPPDPEAIAAALTRTDATMGEAGRVRYEERFTAARMARGVEDELLQITGVR